MVKITQELIQNPTMEFNQGSINWAGYYISAPYPKLEKGELERFLDFAVEKFRESETKQRLYDKIKKAYLGNTSGVLLSWSSSINF